MLITAAAAVRRRWPAARPAARFRDPGELALTGAGVVAARSVYLGPGRPRWTPASHADVVAAAAAGLLDENHHLELKRELPTTRSSNKELARDLASLAVDGGTLVIGVVDADGAAGEVADVDLGGLADRVDQVARAAITPPLTVLCRPLINPATPGRGVLLVEVPASADAPHMVDDRYWGRTGRRKEPLPDAQVRQLFAGRARRADAATQLLDQLVAGSPLTANNPQGSLFALAVPHTPRTDALAEILYSPNASGRLTALRDRVWSAVPGAGTFEPGLTAAAWYEPASDGASLLTPREAQPYWPGLVDLQFGEDGSVRLSCGRGTDELGDGLHRRRVVIGALVIGLTRGTLALAAELADQTGYAGSWDLGLALTRLHDAVDLDVSRRIMGLPQPYRGHNYRRTTTATTTELVDAPEAATARLVVPLLRALGAEHVHSPRLATPVPGPGSGPL